MLNVERSMANANNLKISNLIHASLVYKNVRKIFPTMQKKPLIAKVCADKEMTFEFLIEILYSESR
jgi:hypothetical protein